MTDPNAIRWDENRSFSAYVRDLRMSLTVWGRSSAEQFWWQVETLPGAKREGCESSLIKAKRAAEAEARKWASEIELAGRA